jgi:hypothetical protein
MTQSRKKSNKSDRKEPIGTDHQRQKKGEKSEEGPKGDKRRQKGPKRTKNEVKRDPLGFSGISAQPIRGHQGIPR